MGAPVLVFPRGGVLTTAIEVVGSGRQAAGATKGRLKGRCLLPGVLGRSTALREAAPAGTASGDVVVASVPLRASVQFATSTQGRTSGAGATLVTT